MLNSHIFQCNIEKCERIFSRDVWTFPSIYTVTTWAQTKYLHTSPRLQSSDQLHSNRVLHFAVQKKNPKPQTYCVITYAAADMAGARAAGVSSVSIHAWWWFGSCCAEVVMCLDPDPDPAKQQCKSGLLRLSRGIFTCCRPWIVFGCCHGCR